MAQQSIAGGVRHLKYMFGAVTQIELRNFLEVNSIDSEARKQEIRKDWPAAVARFEGLRQAEAGAPDSISGRRLSAEDEGRAQTLRADATFATTFANYPISFEEVEIDKLIACQRTVHVEYVSYLSSRYEQMKGDVFGFCLPQVDDVPPISIGRTAQNAFTASSENPGLRFLGAFEEPYRPGLLQIEVPGGQAVRAIILVLGYGGSAVNAFRVGRRMILNNGFHRLFTLRGLGKTHAPVVVQHVTHPEVELPPMMGELPREYLVENPRPGLMKDFFEEGLTCEITQRGFLKALQVGWGVQESMVPRGPGRA